MSEQARRARAGRARARAGLAAVLVLGACAGDPVEPARPAPLPPVAVAAAGPPAAPVATPPATPPPAPPPPPPPVVRRGDGVLTVVHQAGDGDVTGARRYLVEVEGGLGVEPAAFAAEAEQTLGDPRSWGAGGRRPLQRVDAGPVEFRVVLASPSLTDELCAPLRTGGRYSCFMDGRAVVNAARWLRGADAYVGRLADYRDYVVNHEVGHALGHGHTGCPRRGEPAPVMMQQTKGVGACRPSAWPFP